MECESLNLINELAETHLAKPLKQALVWENKKKQAKGIIKAKAVPDTDTHLHYTYNIHKTRSNIPPCGDIFNGDNYFSWYYIVGAT